MIQSKLPEVGTTIFTIMSKMASEHQALNLSQGFPDFPVNQEIIELLNKALLDGHNQYAPMTGLPQLREAISDKISIMGGRKLNADREITITTGATEALFASISALVSPGDEVLMLEPTYDSYIPAVQLAGGIPITIPLKQPDFSIDWGLLRQKVNHKTKMLIVNTPHNPSGSTITAGDILEIKKLLQEFPKLIILSDEVYEHIIFDDLKHFSILNYPEIADRVIAVYSFGKTFHATGWRIGYVVAPHEMMIEIRKVHQYLNFSVHTPTQHALATYLKEPSNYLGLPKFYQRKRDLFLSEIKGSSFKVNKSTGTYFQLLDYSEISQEEDFQFAERLVKEFKIAAIPISVFYTDNQDDKLLRFCFAKKEETLSEAGKILRSI